MTMDMGEKQSMAAETKRITVDEDMRPLFEEATTHALIVEIGDQAYRINAERILPDSPYTIDSVYGSLPPINGRPGSEISNEEIEDMIDASKEANARDIFESMNAG